MQSSDQLKAHIERSVAVEPTARVLQASGIFDVPPMVRLHQMWDVDLSAIGDDWHVGVIVGASGAGKSTVARTLFGDALVPAWEWPARQSILDGFPRALSIKDIVALLSSVGFSSPPSWLKPFHVLSTGEQFRVTMARTLAEMPALAVVDEFTSVVDRTVAQIGSSAVARTVRTRSQKFVAVTCHYDVVDWLEPDWVYQPHVNELVRGRLWRRPAIALDVVRVHSSAWALFRPHHYLSHELNPSAICFVAFWQARPVAFASVLHFPHPRAANIKREHRTVCLPDYQGVGIGNALSDYVASLCRALGFRYQSQTSHPAMIHRRARSPNWRLLVAPNARTKTMPSRGLGMGRTGGPATRLRATFEYVGPAAPAEEARRLWQGNE